jgi:hypothetical protein
VGLQKLLVSGGFFVYYMLMFLNTKSLWYQIRG